MMRQKETFARYTVIALTAVYPLWAVGGYNYILQSRFLFQGLVIITLFWGFILLCLTEKSNLDKIIITYNYYGTMLKSTLKSKHKNSPEKRFASQERISLRGKVSLTDLSVSVFFLCCIISTLFSKLPIKALFFGYQSDGVGLFWYLLMGMLYCMIRRTWRPDCKQTFLAVAAGTAVIFLSVLQFLGMDILHLMPSNPDTLHPNNYLSVLGNTGLFAIYLTLLLPLGLGLFFFASYQKNRIAGAVLTIICYFGILCANSDAAYLGMAVSVVMFFVLILIKKKGFLRLLVAGVLFPVSGLFFGMVYRLFASTARPLSRISRFCMFWYEPGDLARPTMESVLSVTIAQDGQQVTDIFSIITHESSFGNGRGYIWNLLIEYFLNNKIFQKLFGNGPGSVPLIIREAEGTDFHLWLGEVFTDAHSAPLNDLTCVGILGVLSLILACVTVVLPRRKCVLGSKICVPNEAILKKTIVTQDTQIQNARTIITVMLISYMTVATVSITQPITGVFFWLLLGLTESLNTNHISNMEKLNEN